MPDSVSSNQSPENLEQQNARELVNQSGGVDMAADNIQVGADVVGRDKFESASGHIIHAKNVTVNPPVNRPMLGIGIIIAVVMAALLFWNTSNMNAVKSDVSKISTKVALLPTILKSVCTADNLVRRSNGVKLVGMAHDNNGLTNEGLSITFTNTLTMTSSIVLPFSPALDGRGCNSVELTVTSDPIDFRVAYEIHINNQSSNHLPSDRRSFEIHLRSYVITMPMHYDGYIDEVVIDFLKPNQSATVLIESISLK